MARAKALLEAGLLASAQGDDGAAQSLYEESLAIFRELGDREYIAVTLGNLGAGYCRAGQGEKGAATLKLYVAGKRKQFPPEHVGFAGLHR